MSTPPPRAARPAPTDRDDLRAEGSDARILATVWPYARPDGWTFVLAVVVTPLVALLNLAQPWLLKRMLDEHVVVGRADGLTQVALLYLAAVVGAYLCQAAYTVALALGGTRTIRRLRSALFRHVLGLSQSFFDRQPTGRLMTRLTGDVDALGDALTAGAVTIVLDGLTIAGVLVAMLLLDPGMTLITILLAPPLLLAINLFRRVARKLFVEVREALAAVNAFMAERIDGVEVVQLYGHEAVAAAQFDRRNQHFRGLTTRSNVYESAIFSLVDGFSSIVVGALLWFGAGELSATFGLDIATVAVSVGTVVAFIDYLDRLFVPLRDASNKIAVIQRAVAALVKIAGLLNTTERVPDGDQRLEALRGHVVLRDVHFRYRPDAPDVLRGVDLEVRPGEVVAIVGATGSGKTTVTRLLDRSYAGYRGSITLDGVELSSLALSDLRRNVAAVRQDIQVFSEDIGFNVDLGNERIDAEDRAQAARLTHANRFIDALGWDHVLRERGADLSVGEGQLLTFARTMAHDPGLIILDEATASIDSLTEALVQDALANIFARKTVIVIAHRLSTVQAADRICVMADGRVAEQGTHDELLAAGGRYAALVAAGEGVLAGPEAAGLSSGGTDSERP
ncbi:MAG: ABC transporter ATP-binding protein [Alphaproteobacteria bacterium]|nr:ABC transporter ATP-binding protein [Alphaproteobacteria bacterium]